MRNTGTHQILVRKRGFPVWAEGRGSSAEAFLRGRACGSSCSQKRRLSTVFEVLSRKQIPKFIPKTFVEAAAEGRSKNDHKRYSRKGFAEGVVSAVKSYKNKNQSSNETFIGLLPTLCNPCIVPTCPASIDP